MPLLASGEVSGFQVLGLLRPGVGLVPTGHLRTVQRRVDCSDVLQCRHRRIAHGWVETVEQGPKSQATSTICSGGVSAVIGSSDLDGLTRHNAQQSV